MTSTVSTVCGLVGVLGRNKGWLLKECSLETSNENAVNCLNSSIFADPRRYSGLRNFFNLK